MGYKGTTKRVKEIGRELDVGSVLEGGVLEKQEQDTNNYPTNRCGG